MIQKAISLFVVALLITVLGVGQVNAQTYDSNTDTLNTTSSGADMTGTSNSSTTTPGLPNTGAGGMAGITLATLIATGALAVAGAMYLRKHDAHA